MPRGYQQYRGHGQEEKIMEEQTCGEVISNTGAMVKKRRSCKKGGSRPMHGRILEPFGEVSNIHTDVLVRK